MRSVIIILACVAAAYAVPPVVVAHAPAAVAVAHAPVSSVAVAPAAVSVAAPVVVAPAGPWASRWGSWGWDGRYGVWDGRWDLGRWGWGWDLGRWGWAWDGRSNWDSHWGGWGAAVSAGVHRANHAHDHAVIAAQNSAHRAAGNAYWLNANANNRATSPLWNADHLNVWGYGW